MENRQFYAFYAENHSTRQYEFRVLPHATLEEAKEFIEEEFKDSNAEITLMEWTRLWHYKTETIVQKKWSE